MRAKEVMRLLGICRTTLYLYTKNGIIKGKKLDNGYYDYSEDSVFKCMKKDNRKNVIYARVSTYKQKDSLKKQINMVKLFCKKKDIFINKIYSEISSGIDFDRPEFDELINDIINFKIKNVYISHKDRLTRLSFKTIKFMFEKFGTNIIVIKDNPNESNDIEIFEEIVSLLHIFSMSMYSNRRKDKLNIIGKDIKNFISGD